MKSTSTYIWTLLLTLFFVPSTHAQIQIDINQSSTRSFPIAVAPLFDQTGSTTSKQAASEFLKTLSQNLEMMGVFRVINPSAFLEPVNQRPKVKASEIDFSTWKTIEAAALVKGTIKESQNNLVLEVYLHDTLLQKQIAAKRYVGKASQMDEMAHAFGNAIVESLLGEKGVFDTQIAFVCKPEKHKELCMMNFNGKNYRKITNHKTIVLSPAWDPLSESIYYTVFNSRERPQLRQLQIKEKKTVGLTNFPGMVIGLTFTPITKQLVTSLTKDGNNELYLLDRYGSIQKRLTNNRNIDVSASFSPDGKEMVFVSDREGSAQVFKMNLATEKVTRLTFKGRNNTSPRWSPDGKKIAFAGMDTDGMFDIFVMNADGSNMKRLTYDSRNNEEPTWAPDSNMIAFASNRTGRYQLYMMRPNGKMQVQLTDKPWDHHMPAWERR